MKRFFLAFATLLGFISCSSSADSIRVAMVQSEFEWGDTQRNIATFETKICSIEGCDLIVLPELFISGCDMQKRDKEIKDAVKRAIAAEYPNLIVKMQEWAKYCDAVIVGSTIYESEDKFYNRLLAVYPSGEYHFYDKHNCFKRGSFSPGDDHLVIDVKGHRFATYICYDLRFSDWSLNNGRYDSAIYIANWPESREEDWCRLLSERAAENSAHVIGVNCVGIDPSGVNFMGLCSLYAPNGELVKSAQKSREEILIVEYKK